MSSDSARSVAVEFARIYYNALSASTENVSKMYDLEAVHYSNRSVVEGNKNVVMCLGTYLGKKFSIQDLSAFPIDDILSINVKGTTHGKSFYHSFIIQNINDVYAIRASSFFNDDQSPANESTSQPLANEPKPRVNEPKPRVNEAKPRAMHGSWASAVGNSGVSKPYVKGIVKPSAKKAENEPAERKSPPKETSRPSKDNARPARRQYDDSKQVFVGNLPDVIDDEALQTYFDEFGSVRSIRVIKGSFNDTVRYYGFVEFNEVEGVDNVLSVKSHEFGGRKLKVESKRIRKPVQNDAPSVSV